MDINELFLACRRGDLNKAQYLVEQREVDVNVRDKWDSTPLYYACLCGHEDLVKYLLDNDARCEANTFDGERCLYGSLGSLNDKIRSLLLSYRAITTTTIKRDLYLEFLRKLLTVEDGESDVSFVVEGQSLRAHRCVLAARSHYFSQQFNTSWAHKQSIPIKSNRMSVVVFRALLQYLYTGRLEVSLDDVDDLLLLVHHCRLFDLEQKLTERLKHVASFECTKPGVSVTVLSIEPSIHETTLQDELSVLAQLSTPTNLLNEVVSELPFPPDSIDMFSDVVFIVEGFKFYCHKVFFAGRSDYFKVLISDSFGESAVSCSEELDECSDKPVITLHDISARVFSNIVFYVYQDTCELTDENVFDVLYKSDLYLLPGLKRQCSAVIGRLLDYCNVISVIRLARLFSLNKLEDQCTEFIARHLEQMLESEEFRALVVEDASTVRSREETDSIPVIDDVRYHVTSSVQTFSDMYEADQKLACIDRFLELLQLDA